MRVVIGVIVVSLVVCMSGAMSPVFAEEVTLGLKVIDSWIWGGNGHEYYAITIAEGDKPIGITWANAELAAQVNWGSHLVTIDSLEEQSFITETFDRRYNYWIGLTDEAQEGTFKWVATGETPTFTYWQQNQPDNFYDNGSDEDYAHILYADFPNSGNGRWNDL